MSLPTHRQAYAFLRPLTGRTCTFVVKNRVSNLAVSRFILGSLAESQIPVVVLDTSRFQGVNIASLTEGLPKDFLQRSVLMTVPDYSTEAEALSQIVGAESRALIIDDVNAVLHLLSSRGRKSGIHRLSTFFHLLSYHARLNRMLILGVVYRSTFGSVHAGITKRSLPKISDLQVTAEVREDGVVFRSSDITAWPAEGFAAPLL